MGRVVLITAHRKPITEAQKDLALGAVDQARENLITATAKAPLPEDWSKQCQELRASLGHWQSIHVVQYDWLNPIVVALVGSAEFANGHAKLTVLFQWNNGATRLSPLHFVRDAETGNFPPMYRQPRLQYRDPPMRRAAPNRIG